MKNMLDASRLDANMVEIERREINLEKIVREVAHIIAPKAEAKGLNLRITIRRRCVICKAICRNLRGY
jgi:signal transduction histidine kinase